MDKVAAAFVKAQKEFAPAIKASKNPRFESMYADLASCVEAVLDALNNHGIALLQPPRECDIGVKVETIFLHESGQMLSGGTLQVPAAKQDPQGYASALTYARRNGLMAACGIAPEDDDGNAATKSAPKAQAKPQQPVGGIHSIDDACTALRACEKLEVLKQMFGDYWQLATLEQKPTIKTVYDKRKAELENEAVPA